MTYLEELKSLRDDMAKITGTGILESIVVHWDSAYYRYSVDLDEFGYRFKGNEPGYSGSLTGHFKSIEDLMEDVIIGRHSTEDYNIRVFYDGVLLTKENYYNYVHLFH